MAVANPDYTEFGDEDGKPPPPHAGFIKTPEGVLTSQYGILGVAQGLDGTVYALALSPYTLLEMRPQRK